MAQAISVHIENLVVTYGAVRAVAGLDLDIEPGEILALLGPSGCGKTTTLRVVGGLVTPNAGSVRFGDRVIDKLPPHRRNVGLVFQNYALFPHMTVFDNIRFGLQMHRVPREQQTDRVYRALDLLQIREHEAKFPDQLSGGQQQRVALARTMVVEPEVVLLDEPLSALDRKLRDQMRVEIRELLKRLSVTGIIVTHDQEEALTMADRIAVMRGGRIEQIGTPHEIYYRPHTRFVAEFIGQANHAEGRVVEAGAGTARVSVGADAVLQAETDLPVTAGETVDLIFRPEAVRVVATDAPMPASPVNRLDGELVRTVFTGERQLLYVRATGLDIIAARSSAASGAELTPAPGDAVAVEWAAAATRIVA